jgi:hypothetical protein
MTNGDCDKLLDIEENDALQNSQDRQQWAKECPKPKKVSYDDTRWLT